MYSPRLPSFLALEKKNIFLSKIPHDLHSLINISILKTVIENQTVSLFKMTVVICVLVSTVTA